MTLDRFSKRLFEADIVHYMTDKDTLVVDESHTAIHGTGHPDAHEYSQKVMSLAVETGVKHHTGSTTRTVFVERQ